jgi:uncharacterized membrane protein YkvI
MLEHYNLPTFKLLKMTPFLQAAAFIVGFLIVLGTFIAFIVRTAKRLNHKIDARKYALIEFIVIAGMALGILGMFQPFTSVLYEPGFLLLLFSTLGFIVWSHVVPARKEV